MAWNEPGKPGQDPWGNGNNPNDNKRPERPQKPRGSGQEPDIEEMIRKVQNFFGGNGGGSNKSANKKGLFAIALVVLAVWLLSGIYTVDSAERGVVKRFGAFTEQTTAGLHWHLPWPIETDTIVNVDGIRNAEIGYRSDARNRNGSVPSEALMLSKDENIVDIKISVQYQVSDVKKYLYDISDPDLTLRALTESSLRETVGKNTMDFVLTEGRDQVVTKVKALAQAKLDAYNTGLIITSLNLQDAQPPEQVQGAFADVVKAREDRERLISESEAYANDILPKARGQAARQLEEARAYYDSKIARATGQASRFDSVLVEYKKAPKVTRERLYLEAVTNVFSTTSKVFVGADSGTNLLYLPLDKMMGQQSSSSGTPFNTAINNATQAVNSNTNPTNTRRPGNIRDFLNTRELR